MTAQLDMFGSSGPELESDRAGTGAASWNLEERRRIELALVGVYQEIAVTAGLHALGPQWRIAHAKACEAIAGDVRGAILHGLEPFRCARQRGAERCEQHAAWRQSDDGRRVYGEGAAADAARFRWLADEQRAELAEYERLMAKVERVVLHELPVDLEAITRRARDAGAAATAEVLDALVDPELRHVTHWPDGMQSNGPMCEVPDCLRCRPKTEGSPCES